ncbi:hypothetical protein JXA88_00645 [Candidatus Fermentibacteria bacterium]|nr:hypothetical protein [Candidatus Fermentibacteria bacterium]
MSFERGTGQRASFRWISVPPDLFGDEQARVEKATMETIGRYFNNRLRELFAGVAEPPGILKNKTNNPLYLLCFAVGSPTGQRTALRIANHLLRELH